MRAPRRRADSRHVHLLRVDQPRTTEGHGDLTALSGGSVPFYAAKHGQSGFHDKLRYELNGTGIRVSAVYPPNFDEADPTDADWDRAPGKDSKLSNREVVSTILFMLVAPRTCNFPVVVMERM